MRKKSINAVILVRASDNERESARQIRELRKVARQREWKVVEVCEEPVSGAFNADSSTALDRLKELVEAGTVTKVIVDEMPRIGRRNVSVLEFLQYLEQNKVSLYWHSQGFETLQANGKRNQKAAIVFALLEEMARAERAHIVERTKAGLAVARSEGRKGGRPKGLSPEAKRNAIKAAALYRKGISTVKICEDLQISRSSLFRYLGREGVKLRVNKKRARKS